MATYPPAISILGSTMNINTSSTLFAVTDHHVILTLNVESVKPLDSEFFKVITTLAPKSDTEYASFHHDSYFKSLYLDSEKNLHIRHPGVFLDHESAKQYAITNTKEEIDLKKRELNSLESKLAALEAA